VLQTLALLLGIRKLLVGLALGALRVSNVLFEHLQRKIVAAGVRARVIEIHTRVREPVLQACIVLHERVDLCRGLLQLLRREDELGLEILD
jgi:hypothetical protein